MKILLAEDDFVTRRLLQTILSGFGDVDAAVNGAEAVEYFKNALNEEKPYDLICLDIMMPEVDGQEALKQIREIEKENGISGLKGAKIIMITALGDFDNIKTAFRGQCEGYIVKPVDKEKLIENLRNLGVIQ